VDAYWEVLLRFRWVQKKSRKLNKKIKANDYVDAYWEVLDYVLEGSVVDPEDLKVMMHRNSKAAGPPKP
jgi:hypothetical protein